MSLEFLIVIIAVLGITFLGWFTLLKNPKSATNKIFFLFALTLAIYLFINYQLSIQNDDKSAYYWVKLVMSIAALINLLFFLFTYTFPKAIISPKGWKLFILITWTISIIFLSQLGYVFTSAKAIQSGAGTPGPGMPLFLLHTILLLGGGFVVLIRHYRRSTGIERLQIKHVIFGAVLMFCAILVVNLFFVVVFKIAAFVGLLPLYILLFVGFVSYAIIKHRFLDIRLIVARAVAYIFLLIFIGVGYIAFLFDVAILINRDKPNRETVQGLIMPAIIALLFAISFQPLRRFFEKITNKFFYKDKYDPNTLLWDLSRIMAATLNLSDLSKKILDKLLEAIKINYGAIVLIRHSSIIWVGGAGKTSDRPFKGKDIYELIHSSNKTQDQKENIIIFEELPESKTKNTMREHNITIALPLVVRKELIGGILLGEKSSGEIYSSEDIDLLKIFAPEVAVAVKNALSYEEIKRFNITLEEEVKRATEKLQNANTKLKELDNLKDEFVSIASHELRTPMTAVKSYLWMAINQPGQTLKDQLKKYLEISYASTERLIRLVNDMLTVSRIERNKIELKLEPINVCDIVKMVYDELKITADQKHITFQLLGCETDKYNVNADKEKLREVFQNIVGNSLKFTPEKGKITINVTMSGPNKIAISTTDTGPGIPKEDLSKLFQKFSRIEYSYTKHSGTPGTGLGLYISKQIVGLHNGDITVESEVNVGTTFTVLLPTISTDGK